MTKLPDVGPGNRCSVTGGTDAFFRAYRFNQAPHSADVGHKAAGVSS